MQSLNKKLFGLLTFAMLGACSGSDQQAETANTKAPAAEPQAETETPDAKTSCVNVFVRQRDCTDDFIPALVDARIRLDAPAGIAERSNQEGRDAIIAEALAEWAGDSQDEAIAGTCDQIVAAVPPAALEPMLASSRTCLAESECQAFAACIIPVIEGQLK